MSAERGPLSIIGDPLFPQRLLRILQARGLHVAPQLLEVLGLVVTIPGEAVLSEVPGAGQYTSEELLVRVNAVPVNMAAGATVSSRDNEVLALAAGSTPRRLLAITGAVEWATGAGVAMIHVLFHLSAMGAAWDDNVGGVIFKHYVHTIQDPGGGLDAPGAFDMRLPAPLTLKAGATLRLSALGVNRAGAQGINVTVRSYCHFD